MAIRAPRFWRKFFDRPGRKFFSLFGSNEDRMHIFMHISQYLGNAQNFSFAKIQFRANSGYMVTLLGINGALHVGILSESSRNVTTI